jgi:hypothetical protein
MKIFYLNKNFNKMHFQCSMSFIPNSHTIRYSNYKILAKIIFVIVVKC